MDLESKVNELTSLVKEMSVTIAKQANAIANISDLVMKTNLPNGLQLQDRKRKPNLVNFGLNRG